MKTIITPMTTMTPIMVMVHQIIQPPVMAFTTTITTTTQIVGELPTAMFITAHSDTPGLDFTFLQQTTVAIHIGPTGVLQAGVQAIMAQATTPQVGGLHMVLASVTAAIITTIIFGTTTGGIAIITTTDPPNAVIIQPAMKLVA